MFININIWKHKHKQYHLVSQACWLLFSDRSGYRVLFPFLGTTDLLLDVTWPQRIDLVPETFAPLVGWYLHILLADALFCALRLGSQCCHLLLLLSHLGYRGWEGLPRIIFNHSYFDCLGMHVEFIYLSYSTSSQSSGMRYVALYSSCKVYSLQLQECIHPPPSQSNQPASLALSGKG